jgi:site-specific DNA-cytosine methylase
MMGAPIGWTDVAGVSRTQRLKQLGNAVFVPAARAVADFVLSLS